MHSIQFSRPSDATRQLVSFYAHRESNLGSLQLIHPVPARSMQALDFEFGDGIELHNLGDGAFRPAQTPALIGIQTYRRVELLIRGRVESFRVLLQPAALGVLFGFPGVNVTTRITTPALSSAAGWEGLGRGWAIAVRSSKEYVWRKNSSLA